MRTQRLVVGMLIATCVGCGWDTQVEEDFPFESLHQAQSAPDATLEAWGSAVEEAMAVGASYDEVQEILESFGRVSFSFAGHLLRQEYRDFTTVDPLEKRFLELHFTEDRFTCYNVGSNIVLPSLVPATGDICQFRSGRTTLGELMAILGSPEFACKDTATFRVRVLDRPVSYYAVLQRTDQHQILETDLVTDLRAFDGLLARADALIPSVPTLGAILQRTDDQHQIRPTALAPDLRAFDGLLARPVCSRPALVAH